MFKDRKIKKLFLNAQRCFNDKNYDDALKIYDELLQIDFHNSHALYKKALIWSIKEEYSESLKLLNSILDIAPCIDALLLKGRVYFSLGDYNNAFNQYKLASDESLFDFFKFTDELTYYQSNPSFFEDEKYTDMFLDLSDMILEKEDVLDIRVFRAHILNHKGRYEDALSNINYVLVKYPDHPFANTSKSLILFNLKRYDESLVAIDKDLKKNPDDSFLNCNKAEILYKLNKLEESEKFCNISLSLDDETDMQYILSKIYIKRKDYGSALKFINLLLEGVNLLDDLSYNKYFWCKSLILSNLNRYGEAHEICDCLIQREADNPKNDYLKSKILFDEGKFDESLEYINKTLDLDPDCPEAIELKNKIEN